MKSFLTVFSLLVSFSFSQKTFISPLNNFNEYYGYWVEPNTEYSRHGLYARPDGVYHIGETVKSNPTPGAVHRAYPTFQPWKTIGSFGPSTTTLWFKFGCSGLPAGEWLSLATFAKVKGDTNWDPVCLNINPQANLYLMHTPLSGQKIYSVLGDTKIVTERWYRLDVLIDFRPSGSILVLLDRRPILFAQVLGGDGYLHQAHFGLYSSGKLTNTYIANDSLSIIEHNIAR